MMVSLSSVKREFVNFGLVGITPMLFQSFHPLVWHRLRHMTTFLVPDLALRWLKAWGFAFAVAFPTVTFVAPLVHRLVAIVLKEGPRDA